jgi:hypothetical protein
MVETGPFSLSPVIMKIIGSPVHAVTCVRPEDNNHLADLVLNV